MRISDWSSDVCSSDLLSVVRIDFERDDAAALDQPARQLDRRIAAERADFEDACRPPRQREQMEEAPLHRRHIDRGQSAGMVGRQRGIERGVVAEQLAKSEEHTSELQSLMRISYAVFCLKKKINKNKK